MMLPNQRRMAWSCEGENYEKVLSEEIERVDPTACSILEFLTMDRPSEEVKKDQRHPCALTTTTEQ